MQVQTVVGIEVGAFIVNLADQSFVLAPLIVYVAFVFWGRVNGEGWMNALLRGWIWWVGLVWVMSNLLGLGGWLTSHGLRGAWSGVALISLVGIWGVKRRLGGRNFGQSNVVPRQRFSPLEWVCLAGCGSLALLALVTAAVAPPVTVDVLNYHAPRQLMWLQQGSMSPFISVNDRQIMMPPLAEVIGLQFLALTGGDYLANLPQWFAYVLLPVALASIACDLGLPRWAAWLAAWLAACLPMAYLDAANGKNDLQAALWVALLFREVVQARSLGAACSGWTAVRVGVCAGLAVLTKSTVLVMGLPLVLMGVWVWIKTERRSGWRAVGVAGAVGLLVAMPFYARNFAWYGTPLGIHRVEDGGGQANAAFSPGLLASNIMRNATHHMAMPSESWNRTLEGAVMRAHERIGVSANDPRSTGWGGVFGVGYSPAEETLAGAPWHFFLIVCSAIWVWTRREGRPWRWLAWMTLALAVGYCVVVKWQPWAPRLHQPIFVSGLILVVAVLANLRGRFGEWVGWVVLAGGLLAWWPSREAWARPLWGDDSIFTAERTEASYRYLPKLQERDEAIVALLVEAGVSDVLVKTVHDISYPLMKRMRAEIPDVHFYGAPVSDSMRHPRAIVSLDRLAPAALYYHLADGARYRLVGDMIGDGVYLPDAKVRELGWTQRLPDFAGWTKQEGLSFRLNHTSNFALPSSWREMEAEEARLHFASWGAALRLDLVVIKPWSGPETLEIAWGGRVVERIELPESSVKIGFSLQLGPSRGDQTLVIRREGAARGKLLFTRISFNDVEASEAPMR